MSDTSLAVDAWEALFRAQVSVLRILGTDFPVGDISFNEYDVLFNLSRQPDRSARIRDLNKQLLLTQPSVSRLLDRLAARGLVRKQPDPLDGRGTIVRLTEEGYERFRAVALKHVGSIRSVVGSGLDPEELQELARLCDKLRASAAKHR